MSARSRSSAPYKRNISSIGITNPRPLLKRRKLNNDNDWKLLSKAKSTISITFGDVSENHVGMHKNGQMAAEGFNLDDLKKYQKQFVAKHGNKTEFILLNDYLPNNTQCDTKAAVLIIRNAVGSMLQNIDKNANDLYEEQSSLPIDTKYYDRRWKKVLNKNARGNLCFDTIGQSADYKNGKGTVIPYDDVPLTKHIQQSLAMYFGSKAENLTAEGNYYYDISKCGIGFHGDAERKKVIGVRLGQSMPLHYQWFHKFKPIGKRCELMINESDVYLMSEKATGCDWKRSSVLTLRHAAGAKKYLTIKKKKKKIKK